MYIVRQNVMMKIDLIWWCIVIIRQNVMMKIDLICPMYTRFKCYNENQANLVMCSKVKCYENRLKLVMYSKGNVMIKIDLIWWCIVRQNVMMKIDQIWSCLISENIERKSNLEMRNMAKCHNNHQSNCVIYGRGKCLD